MWYFWKYRYESKFVKEKQQKDTNVAVYKRKIKYFKRSYNIAVNSQSLNDLNEIHRMTTDDIILNLTTIVFSIEVVHVQSVSPENCQLKKRKTLELTKRLSFYFNVQFTLTQCKLSHERLPNGRNKLALDKTQSDCNEQTNGITEI